MRIALCVKRDLYGLIAARAFLEALNVPSANVAIFCSVKTRATEEASPWLSLLKILERDLPFDVLRPGSTIGTPSAAEATLRRAWQQLGDLRPDGGGGQLLGWRPDLVVSMRFSLIFPRRIIEGVPGGIINVHPGALPGYRGLFAPFWQAAAREPVLVSTVHLVDAGIDTGPILGEHAVPRDEGRSLMWHIGALYRGGARLAAEVAAKHLLQDEPLAARPQPEAGRYWSFPSDRDIAAFAEDGMRLFCSGDYRALLAEALGTTPPALTLGTEAA